MHGHAAIAESKRIAHAPRAATCERASFRYAEAAMPDVVLLLVASLVPLCAVALALFAGRGESDRER